MDTPSSKKPSLMPSAEESSCVSVQRQERALFMGDNGKCSVVAVSDALVGEAGKLPEWRGIDLRGRRSLALSLS